MIKSTGRNQICAARDGNAAGAKGRLSSRATRDGNAAGAVGRLSGVRRLLREGLWSVGCTVCFTV